MALHGFGGYGGSTRRKTKTYNSRYDGSSKYNKKHRYSPSRPSKSEAVDFINKQKQLWHKLTAQGDTAGAARVAKETSQYRKTSGYTNLGVNDSGSSFAKKHNKSYTNYSTPKKSTVSSSQQARDRSRWSSRHTTSSQQSRDRVRKKVYNRYNNPDPTKPVYTPRPSSSYDSSKNNSSYPRYNTPKPKPKYKYRPASINRGSTPQQKNDFYNNTITKGTKHPYNRNSSTNLNNYKTTEDMIERRRSDVPTSGFATQKPASIDKGSTPKQKHDFYSAVPKPKKQVDKDVEVLAANDDKKKTTDNSPEWIPGLPIDLGNPDPTKIGSSISSSNINSPVAPTGSPTQSMPTGGNTYNDTYIESPGQGGIIGNMINAQRPVRYETSPFAKEAGITYDKGLIGRLLRRGVNTAFDERMNAQGLLENKFYDQMGNAQLNAQSMLKNYDPGAMNNAVEGINSAQRLSLMLGIGQQAGDVAQKFAHDKANLADKKVAALAKADIDALNMSNNAAAQVGKLINEMYGYDSSNYAAEVGAQAQHRSAQMAAEAQKYASDKGLEGARLAADAQLAGNKYSSDKQFESTKYGVDNSPRYTGGGNYSGGGKKTDTVPDIRAQLTNTYPTFAEMNAEDQQLFTAYAINGKTDDMANILKQYGKPVNKEELDAWARHYQAQGNAFFGK